VKCAATWIYSVFPAITARGRFPGFSVSFPFPLIAAHRAGIVFFPFAPIGASLPGSIRSNIDLNPNQLFLPDPIRARVEFLAGLRLSSSSLRDELDIGVRSEPDDRHGDDRK
jgi:hypothetical protein